MAKNPSWEKPFSISICLWAAVMLSIRIHVAMQKHGSTLLESLWFTSHYFTILTNGWVVLIMAHVYRHGMHSIPSAVSLSLVTAVLLVSVIFHVALSHLMKPIPGMLALVSDQGVHTFVPLLTLAWWLALEKRRLDWSLSLFTVVWPLTYFVYILFRAVVLEEDFYPYYFMNLRVLGWSKLLINMVVLATIFVGTGSLLIGMNRRLVVAAGPKTTRRSKVA